jgi:HPt (histidine-containing phosphotransfer) domain-containing protein
MEMPVIDWPRLLIFRDLQPPGEADIVAELIDSFLSDSAARLERLHAAAAAGNLRGVAHEAHSIKGAAALLAADPLSAEAEAVEIAANAGLAQDLPPLLVRLNSALNTTHATLSRGPGALE